MAATGQFECASSRCTKLFTARMADRKRGWGLYCSKHCKAVAQEQRTGQHATYLQRREASEEHDHDEAMYQTEVGWDAHKGYT